VQSDNATEPYVHLVRPPREAGGAEVPRARVLLVVGVELGFGPIVVSEIDVSNMLANPV
jgi:hypothetical protein